jgi:hypothetical protein
MLPSQGERRNSELLWYAVGLRSTFPLFTALHSALPNVLTYLYQKDERTLPMTLIAEN